MNAPSPESVVKELCLHRRRCQADDLYLDQKHYASNLARWVKDTLDSIHANGWASVPYTEANVMGKLIIKHIITPFKNAGWEMKVYGNESTGFSMQITAPGLWEKLKNAEKKRLEPEQICSGKRFESMIKKATAPLRTINAQTQA